MTEVLNAVPPEVEKYSGKEYWEIPTEDLRKIRDFHVKCAENLPLILAKEHKKIVEEIDRELANREVKQEVKPEPLEAYFKNLLRSVLKEAVRRGVIKKDQTVEELIEANK